MKIFDKMRLREFMNLDPVTHGHTSFTPLSGTRAITLKTKNLIQKISMTVAARNSKHACHVLFFTKMVLQW